MQEIHTKKKNWEDLQWNAMKAITMVAMVTIQTNDQPTDRPIYGIRDKEMMFACKKIIEMEYR